MHTINDVLSKAISSGLLRYLDYRTPNALQEGLQVTGMSLVNIRKQPGNQWGNKLGVILLPVEYHKSNTAADPLNSIKRAKTMFDRKKYSLGALSITKPLSCHTWEQRILCNTSFAISNIVGAQDEIAFGENIVTYIRVNASSSPHALMMTMVSIAGRADLQILVAKDISPNPEFLAKCFEYVLLETKEAAKIL